MIKKGSFKIAVSFVLTIIILLSLASTNVLAVDETKNVSVTVHQNITAPNTAIGDILRGISSSTYYYDDGSYKGTLNYSYYTNYSESYYASYPGIVLYRYSFDVVYSGTVTKYTPIQEITVNKTVTQNIVAPEYAINDILRSFTTSTQAYDDGTFRGTLYYTGMSGYSKTFYASYPGITLYRFTFDVYYSGTATRY